MPSGHHPPPDRTQPNQGQPQPVIKPGLVQPPARESAVRAAQRGSALVPPAMRRRYCDHIDGLDGIAAPPAGEDFEELCWGLLQRRYAPKDLIRLPSTMGGDRGLEGFSTDRIAYQCYADQDSITLRQRTDKQKRKLTQDTGKLKTYSKELTKLFAGNQILLDFYFLMVPQFHAAELQFHAADRAQKVRGFGLPFISDRFAIRIVTPRDYPDEYRALVAGGYAELELTDPQVEAAAPQLFQSEKPELVTTLDRKIEVILTDTGGRETLRDIMVRYFLESEQLLLELEEWPHTRTAIEERQVLCERKLELENLLSSNPAANRVSELIASYQNDLLANVPGLRQVDAARLASGQVSEWLMRCPLRFREPA